MDDCVNDAAKRTKERRGGPRRVITMNNEFFHRDLETLACELPDEVLKYKMCGDIAGAYAAIDRWMERPVAQVMKDRMQMEKRFLSQLPQQYPYTAKQAVEAMQEKVPEFSEKDLERLDQQGLAEWIFLDGEKHYVHNLVRNVLMKDAETKQKAGQDQEDEEKKLLKTTIQSLKQKGILTWLFHLKATLQLKDEVFTPGMKLKAHLPIPAEHFQISDVEILDYSKEPEVQVSIDSEDSMYRSICFEAVLEENKQFFVEYAYTVTAGYHDLSEEDRAASEQVFEKDEQVYELYTKEQYPHIRFTPYLRALAAEIVGEETDPLKKARKIYDYVTTSVKYSLMREYFFMEDIPQYCARNLRGDCGVQALLFITLCRISGVPAKWQSGLYAIPGSVGAHDWAMFYVEPFGWLFADPSFGGSAYQDEDEDRRSFYFGNLDPFRMVANNAFQQTFANPKTYQPIDPYDNQLGEIESEERGFRSYEMTNTKVMLEGYEIEN